MYDVDGKAVGFLYRAVGSLIEKPAQESPAFEPVSAMKALHSQMSVLMQRGMPTEVCTLVYHDQLERLRCVRSWSGGPTVMKIPLGVMYAPVGRSGLGCPPPGAESASMVKFPP